jgi:hypothetical protein
MSGRLASPPARRGFFRSRFADGGTMELQLLFTRT